MKNRMSILGITFLPLLLISCGRQHCEQYEPWQCDVVKEDYVHTYGIPIKPQDWVVRGQNGQVVSTLRNGVMVTKTYRDGYLEGETTYTFPHSGAIQKVETYSNGVLLKEVENYPSGAPYQETEFHTSSSKTVRSWDEKGAPKFRESHENDKLSDADYYTPNNQVESRINEGNGSRVQRDEFGQLMQIDQFRDGVLILSTTYFPNGSPKEVIPYQNGQVNGQKKVFFPGGDPRALEGWTDNRQEGITVMYHNGERISEIPYFSGMKNGIEQRFKDGQLLVEEITWKNDRKHGPSHAYQDGGDIRVDWYYEGRLVTKKQYDRYINPPI